MSGVAGVNRRIHGMGRPPHPNLPAFADGADTLLLQRLSEPLDTGKLQLFTDLTKELVAFIDLDRAATAKKS